MLSSILEFEGETSTCDDLQREFEVNDVHKTIINNNHASAVVFLLTFPMQSNNNNSTSLVKSAATAVGEAGLQCQHEEGDRLLEN